MVIVYAIFTILGVLLANVIGLLILGAIKEIFFSAYVKNKNDNPFYNNFNRSEILIVSIVVLIVTIYKQLSQDSYP